MGETRDLLNLVVRIQFLLQVHLCPINMSGSSAVPSYMSHIELGAAPGEVTGRMPHPVGGAMGVNLSHGEGIDIIFILMTVVL